MPAAAAGRGRRLELLQIKRWVGETTFERGLDYADRGKIAHAAREGDVLTAEVEGSTPRGAEKPAMYRVRVDLEPPVPRAGCTCPVRRPFCKHAAAVLILWQREPEAFAEQPGEAAQRNREPSKADRRRQMLLEELEAVRGMLSDFAIHGVTARGKQWVDAVPQILATARRRRQLRLAELLDELQRQVTGATAPDPRHADLLMDLWFTLEATRRYVEGKPIEERVLEQLIGTTPREAGLARRYHVPLLELAYEQFPGPLGARHDVSYLIDMNSGELFVERLVVPARRAQREEPKPWYPEPLVATEMGIYPGYPPLRIALIGVAAGSTSLSDAVVQALDLGEASLAAIHERLAQSAADPFAPEQTFALLKPHGLLERSGVLHLLDAEGYCVPVCEQPLPHAPTLAAFEAYARERLPTAVFARFHAPDLELCAAPLSIVEPSGMMRLTAPIPVQ
jgi:hypothetical protein